VAWQKLSFGAMPAKFRPFMQLGSLTLATIRKIIPWPPLSQVNTLKNNCPWQRRLVLLPVLLVVGLTQKKNCGLDGKKRQEKYHSESGKKAREGTCLLGDEATSCNRQQNLPEWSYHTFGLTPPMP
jgi:hypothetical protein